MTRKQRELAIEAIQKYATIQFSMMDHEGGYCALGALLIADGESITSLYHLDQTNLIRLYSRYGLNLAHIDHLLAINDTRSYCDVTIRRKRLIECLFTIPLTEETLEEKPRCDIQDLVRMDLIVNPSAYDDEEKVEEVEEVEEEELVPA